MCQTCLCELDMGVHQEKAAGSTILKRMHSSQRSKRIKLLNLRWTEITERFEICNLLYRGDEWDCRLKFCPWCHVNTILDFCSKKTYGKRCCKCVFNAHVSNIHNSFCTVVLYLIFFEAMEMCIPIHRPNRKLSCRPPCEKTTSWITMIGVQPGVTMTFFK